MRLHADGNKLIAENREVMLRGCVLYYSTHKYPHGGARRRDGIAADHYLMDLLTNHPDQGGWGANCVQAWVENDPIHANEADYWRWLDGLVEIAGRNKSYLYLTWHNDNGWQGHPSVPTPRGRETMFRVARRYAGNPRVFYGAIAETANNNSQSYWNNTCAPAIEMMIDRIREADPDAMVAVPVGMQWKQGGHFLNKPINRPNILVTRHIYEGTANALRMMEQVRHAGWPVLVGEFGWGGTQSRDEMLQMLRWCENNRVGWTAWAFTTEGGPELLQDLQGTPTAYGRIVRDDWLRPYASSPQDPGPPVLQENVTLIDDGRIQGPWRDWSWGLTVTPLPNGPLRLEVTGAVGGLQLSSPERVNLQGVKALVAEVRAEAALDGIWASLYKPGANATWGKVAVLERAYALEEDWERIVVPMVALGAEGQETDRVELVIEGAGRVLEVRSLALVLEVPVPPEPPAPEEPEPEPEPPPEEPEEPPGEPEPPEEPEPEPEEPPEEEKETAVITLPRGGWRFFISPFTGTTDVEVYRSIGRNDPTRDVQRYHPYFAPGGSVITITGE